MKNAVLLLLAVTGSTFANEGTSGQNQYNIIALDLMYPIGTNALFSYPVNAINIGSAFSKTFAVYGISVTSGFSTMTNMYGLHYVDGNGAGLMVTPIFQNVSGTMSGLMISPICNKTGYMRGMQIGLIS